MIDILNSEGGSNRSLSVENSGRGYMHVVRQTAGLTNFVHIFIENQQMHQNDQFIVMLCQPLLHVSGYQCHHQGSHVILTSYLYVGVHCRKNNGMSCEVAPIGNVTLWM
jgi:hypothetical protein